MVENWNRSTILKYVQHRIFYIIPMLYILLSIIINSMGIEFYTIPCVYKTLFGLNCFGCGLTTACIKLFQFDFIGAFNSNFLIYPLILIIPFVVIKDFKELK